MLWVISRWNFMEPFIGFRHAFQLYYITLFDSLAQNISDHSDTCFCYDAQSFLAFSRIEAILLPCLCTCISISSCFVHYFFICCIIIMWRYCYLFVFTEGDHASFLLCFLHGPFKYKNKLKQAWKDLILGQVLTFYRSDFKQSFWPCFLVLLYFFCVCVWMTSPNLQKKM